MSKKIIYTLIAKEHSTVLCSSTEYSGNFQKISQALISQLTNEHSFHGIYNNYSYYYLFKNKIKYLCVTEGMPMDKAMNYLYEVQTQFSEEYSNEEIVNADPYQMLKFDSFLIKISNLFEEGKDTLLKNSNGINLIDYNPLHEEKIEKFLADFDDIKKPKAEKKAGGNRREFRLSVR